MQATVWPAREQRILVADTPGAMATVRAALGRIAELEHAPTLVQALRALKRGVDLVICGVGFDDGRMLELLARIPEDIAVICLRDIDSPLEEEALKGLSRDCSEHGAARFFDIHSLRRAHGTVNGYRELRLAALALLDEREARRLLATRGEKRHAGAGH